MLLARSIELTLAFDHTVVELGMAFLAVGQLHVQLFKACFSGDAALLQLIEFHIDLAEVGLNLLTAGAGLFGQLRQAQDLHLQGMAAALSFSGFAARCHQALRSFAVSRLSAHQGAARLVANQGLRTKLFVQVFNFLSACQQPGLLGILRVKAHAVLCHSVTALHINHFAGLQLAAARQCFIQVSCRVAALQPVGQQSTLPRIGQTQVVCQRLEPSGTGPGGRASHRRGVKRQFGRRRIATVGAGKAAHHVQATDFERAQAFAQRGL